MTKFDDVSLGILILLFIIAIIEIYYIYTAENYNNELELFNVNDNAHSVVTKHELKRVLSNHLEKKKTPSISGIIQSFKSGFLRGGLMGLTTHGLEGALVGGIVLGVVNPIVSGIEHKL